MKPFAWYDHFNDAFYREEDSAQAAEAGGNKVTPVYTAESLPDCRFAVAVAALQGVISNPLTGTHRAEDPETVAKSAVAYADALLTELAR